MMVFLPRRVQADSVSSQLAIAPIRSLAGTYTKRLLTRINLVLQYLILVSVIRNYLP
jgi:hypothetical protein